MLGTKYLNLWSSYTYRDMDALLGRYRSRDGRSAREWPLPPNRTEDRRLQNRNTTWLSPSSDDDFLEWGQKFLIDIHEIYTHERAIPYHEEPP